MALRLFHKILIGAGVVFFLGYGAREVLGVLRERPGSHLALAVGSVAAGVGLALYLVAFGRRGQAGTPAGGDDASGDARRPGS